VAGGEEQQQKKQELPLKTEQILSHWKLFSVIFVSR
jgi:hypothetical protein